MEPACKVWVHALPRDLLQARPLLCYWLAWSLVASGDLARSAQLAAQAEHGWRATGTPADLGKVLYLRAHMASLQGDAALTIDAAEQALALLRDGDHFSRSGSLVALGRGQLMTGDVLIAQATLEEARARCAEIGNVFSEWYAMNLIADALLAQGRLQDAAATSQAVIRLIGERLNWHTGFARIRLASLAYAWNDLAAATEQLAQGRATLEQYGMELHLGSADLLQADLLTQQGDRSPAHAALDQAMERAQRLGNRALAGQVAARRVLVALRQSDLPTAARAMPSLPLDDPALSAYQREPLVFLRARMLLEEDPTEALGQLHYLLDRAEEQGRMGSMLESLVLIALAQQRRGEHEQALASVSRALELAAPMGAIRVFLAEGATIGQFIAQLARKGLQRDVVRTFVEQLIVAFREPSQRESSGGARSSVPALVEPLTARARGARPRRCRSVELGDHRPVNCYCRHGQGSPQEPLRQAQGDEPHPGRCPRPRARAAGRHA